MIDAMNEIPESAIDENAQRMSYIRNAFDELQEEVIKEVQFIFGTEAVRWDYSLK